MREMVRKRQKRKKERSGQLICSKRCCRRKEEVEWVRRRIYMQLAGEEEEDRPCFPFLPDHGFVEKIQGKKE